MVADGAPVTKGRDSEARERHEGAVNEPAASDMSDSRRRPGPLSRKRGGRALGLLWRNRDPRLLRLLDELALSLDFARRRDLDADEEAALNQANKFLMKARENAAVGGEDPNEDGWAYYHAARREGMRLRSGDEVALLEIDLAKEADEKLESWRRKAVDAYPMSMDIGTMNRLVRVQQHLDEAAENDNRKRRLRSRQLRGYGVLLVLVFASLLALEFVGRGLVIGDQTTVDGWWAVAVALYGTAGGAFSAARRVASAGPKGRYPEHLWDRLTNLFRAVSGGVAALIAFAALEAGLLGEGAVTGPRVVVIAFVAGFSERFFPSLVREQEG